MSIKSRRSPPDQLRSTTLGNFSTVPWRLVNLIREFTDHFEVLIPHRAYSAATLVALGADQIVMHAMGELGPIDPSVANAFNPRDPTNPSQQIPISVEDVLAYVALVKEDVGIRHEDELVQALTAFTSSQQLPIHPLALGNVKRHHARSRSVAKKLLMKHMTGAEAEIKMDRIVDNLTTKLFYHGHPISRREAKEDLDLKVDVDAPAAVTEAMWDLYLEYESELSLTTPFSPPWEFEKAAGQVPHGPLQPVAPPGPQMQMVMGPQGPMMVPPAPVVSLRGLKGAFVETETRCDVLETDMKLKRLNLGPQEVINIEFLRTEWTKQP